MTCFQREALKGADLYLGDALEVLPTLPAGSFGALLTDPPYSSGGSFRSDRAAPTSAKYQSPEHRGLYPEFQGDSRDQRGFLAWSTLWMLRARALVVPGGLCAVFTDWRQLPVTSDALQAAGWVWRGVVAWDKTEAGWPQLGRYRSQAEYVIWGTNGPRPLRGPTAPGVIRVAVPKKKHHIAGKPVELMRTLMTIMDGPILDPFMGSGPVGLACRVAGLPYTGIEIDRTYFEVARRRFAEVSE